MKTSWLWLFLVAAATRLAAADTPGETMEAVRAALAANEAVQLSRWAYTVTTTANGEKTVERHDPAAAGGDRWQLIRKNGRPPTEQELKDYAGKRRRSGDDRQQLGGLVDLATLRVLTNDLKRLTCAFRMKADDAEDRLMSEKIQGTLVVQKDPPAVERLDLVNTSRISKLGVLNIKEFITHLRFRRDPASGEPLPERIRVRVQGRALLVKSLNNDSEKVFSDFQRRNP